jgi:hypothetical protein
MGSLDLLVHSIHHNLDISLVQTLYLNPLPVAGSGSGRRGARYSGPESKRSESSQKVLPQAIKGIGICPASDHHRQTEELQRGESGSDTKYRAPPEARGRTTTLRIRINQPGCGSV